MREEENPGDFANWTLDRKGVPRLATKIKGRVTDMDAEGKLYTRIVETTPGRMLLGECLPKNYKVPFDIVNRLLTNLSFTAEQESQLMEPIMAREDAKAVARKWLKDNPQELRRFLDGVTTVDGRSGADSVLAVLQ